MDATVAQSLVDIVLKYENLIVVLAVWFLVSRLTVVAHRFNGQFLVWWVRLLPIIPLVLATAAMWLPGIAQAQLAIGERLLLGCVLGGATAYARKVFRQSILGKDSRLPQ